MWEDWEAAQRFRLDTIKYVRFCLGLAPAGEKELKPENPILRCFDVIGFAIRDACSMGMHFSILFLPPEPLVHALTKPWWSSTTPDVLR
jgi:hypothetical protein